MSNSSSPGVSPTKPSANNGTALLSPMVSMASKPQSVRNKVARLSISETNEVKRDILHSLNYATNNTTTSHASHGNFKRRRSSAALSSQLNLSSVVSHNNNNNNNNNDNNSKSRQNSITSGKVIKKKKRNSANKPLDIKILDKFFHSEEPINHKGHNDHYNVSQNIKKKYRISIKDIRDLVVFLMNGTNNSPQWVNISNRASLNKLVVLFIPGLEPQDYNLPQGSSFFLNGKTLRRQQLQPVSSSSTHEPSMPHLENIAVCAPGSRLSLFSAYNSFVNVGLTKNEKIALKNELSKKQITVLDLLMPLEKLLENNYPIHIDTPDLTEEYRNKLLELQKQDSSNEWVDTKPDPENTSNASHIYGIDCEMCMSESGLVLTRVSIINFQTMTILDKLVKPDVPITDYLTQYSGITKEKLDPVTITLQDVQQDILKIVNSNDILVGHSLQSDLNVLKLRHPKIIDTAIIFDHKAGPPFKPSLKFLVSEYLNYNIQMDNNKGHDSIEDAKACIDLLKLKIARGMAFGISVDTENLFHRVGKLSQKRSLLLNDSVATSISSSTTTAGYVSSIRCHSDKEIMDNIVEHMNSNDFFVGRLRDLEFARQYSKPSLVSMRQLPPQFNEETETITLQSILNDLNHVYDNLPSNSVIMLISGSGNTKSWTQLMNDLNKCDTKEEKMIKRQLIEKDIEKAIVKARDGVATFIIKD